MEVILIERHNKLGEIGTIVNVKNGYARNYLIPTNKAIRATEENQKIYELRKVEIQKEFDSKKADAEKVKKSLDSKHIVLIEQAAEDERLYGSVNANHIVKEIKEQLGQELHKSTVGLISQIKYLGVYEVAINVFADISAAVRIIVARTQAESEQTLKKLMEPAKKEKKKDKSEEIAAKEEELDKDTKKKTVKAKSETKTEEKKKEAKIDSSTKKEEKK